MTTIELYTRDQEIFATSSPVISSGDKNSVKLKVTFDSEWDSYTKTAVFYKGNNPVAWEMLLEGGECIIPSEVTSEAGYIFMGARGITSNSKVKTSALIKYKVSNGANGNYVYEPTDDIYKQMLTRFENLLTAGTVDGELIDIRAGADGIIYPTAGEAVRTQLNKMLQPFKYHVNDNHSAYHKVTDMNNLEDNRVYLFSIKNLDIANLPDGYKDGKINFCYVKTIAYYYKNTLCKNQTITDYWGTELDIDLLNPQNTKITVGNTELSLIDANSRLQSTTVRRIQSVEAETVKNKKEISEVKNQAVTKTICDEMISATLKSYVKTSSYNEFKQTVETEFEKLSAEISVHSDTGWIDLELQSGISVGSENAYLKGRLKDNVLYIKGDVVGISANQECFAQVPENLIPDNMTSTCFNAVYDMLHFCGMRLISDGQLYVTSNVTGSWDTTKNTTVNVAICV